MTLRPKTFRRLVILAIGILLVVGATGTFYGMRKKEMSDKIAQSRVDGMAAAKAGDKEGALKHLSYYLSKVKDDAEAMIAFADVRRTVPADKGTHLREAAQWYSGALHKDPDNIAAKRALLEIYPQIGFNSEAKALADEVLKTNPNDMDALRSKMNALARLEQFEPALATAQRMAEVDPNDYRAQAYVIDLMSQTKKPAEEIKQLAADLLAKHPDDPRFEMLQALANRNDKPLAADWLKKAAGRTPPDANFARDLSRLMEQAGMYAEARDYLERYHSKVEDPQILLVLAQRLWQDEKYDAVLERLKDLSPTDVSADADLLALKAMSSQQKAMNVASTQPTEQRTATTQPATELTRQIVAALKGRPNDAAARTWAMALDTMVLNPPASPRDRATQLSRAITAGRENGIVRYVLGQTNLELGETETALNDLRTSAAVMTSWEAPYLLMARALLAGGRPGPAMEAAYAANQRNPQDANAAVLYSIAWYARLGEAPDPASNEKLLDQVTKLQARFRPDGEPQTLPIYVSLLSRLGNKDAAIAATKAALSARRPYPLESLLKLSAASRQQKLGLETQILEHATKVYGSAAPIALARATVLADAGKPTDGLALLEDAAQASGKPDAMQWQFMIAQYREGVRDPEAGASWAKLGDAYPNNLAVQNAILSAASRFGQREAWSKAIDRLRALTGDTANGWRIERARYVLSGVVDPNGKELSETMNDMAALTRQNPDTIEPRLLLASALVQAKNVAGAVKQLEAAAELRPTDVTIGLQLYKLLREEGRLDESRTYMERLASSKTFGGESRVQVAAALADVGQSQRAIDLLNAAAADDSALAARDLLLARLYRRAGNTQYAAAVYNRWLTNPAPDASILSAAADFFASMNKPEEAQKFLDRLNAAPLQPGQRELILATYEEMHGSRERAATLLAEATKLAPTDASAWRQWAAFEIRAQRYDQALSKAQEGLTHVPGDSDLQTMKQQAQALAGGNDSRDLQPLIDLMSRDPRNAAGAATLKVLTDAKTSGQSEARTLDQLRDLADRYPQFLPLQGVLARAYLVADRNADAAAIATRAEQLFPSDAQAARIATQVYSVSNRPDLMLAAAMRWRRLANENPMEADASVARAQIATGDLSSARSTLAPYVAQARLEPDRYPELLAANAQLLVASGQPDDAAALLAPLAKESAAWRTTWRTLVDAHPNGPAAMKWVETIPQPAGTPSADEQYAQAAAWFDVGRKYNQRTAFAKSKAILEGLTSASTATLRQWRLLAYVNRALEDMAGSMAAFRKVLELEPNQPDTQNNIAYMLFLQGGDLNEARRLAESAVAIAPKSASYLDTLAHIQQKQGDLDAALATFNKALEIDPRNLEVLLGKTNVLLTQNKKDEAAGMLPQIEQSLRNAGSGASDATRNQVAEIKRALAAR